ncbi:surface lipoprotein assembly modifier [Neisseria animalis]|uniref:surface lipoprotein assembly modifier n=1 Tax=Neisseria animalis TaxID=492 RepID=UPI001E49B967|nr:surface lipoprotein assembly modifier [Neisseria animalis]
MNGKTWQKTADSLPQSAHGIRYGLSVSGEKNLNGNHFAHLEVGGNGVHYWDNQEYNEQTIKLSAGYKFQNSRYAWRVTPFAEQNWLGGSRYNRVIGTNVSYSHRFNNNFRLMLSSGQYWKTYHDEHIASRYNSRTPHFQTTLFHTVSPRWLSYVGTGWNHELAEETEQSSIRKSVHLGTIKTFPNGLGMRANLSYARRTFDAPGSLVYHFNRKDHEYQINTSLWHHKFTWHGFMPQLNVRYQKINSNMSGFYSRKNLQWFISVEKQL